MKNLIEVLLPFTNKKTYLKGSTISNDLAKSGKLFFIDSGNVLVQYNSELNKRMFGSLKKHNTWLGWEYLESGDSEMVTQLTAYRDTQILSLSIAQFKGLVDKQLKDQELLICQLIMKILLRHNYEISATLYNRNLSRSQLVLKSMRQLANDFGSPTELGNEVKCGLNLLSDVTGSDPTCIRKHINTNLRSKRLVRTRKGYYVPLSESVM